MNQESELIKALDDWATDFKKKSHPVSLTLFRAAAEIRKMKADRDRLICAVNDAIRRPRGVVPASAEEFYKP